MRSSESASRSTRDGDLAAAVARCRERPALLGALREVYAQADRAAGEAGRVCLGGGACCRFDLFDHRLYVTPAELAVLTWRRPARAAGPGRCPYQVGPRCAAHDRRPLGCRMFFCRDIRKISMQRTCERLHRRVRQLHETHCIPYAYGELCRSILQLFLDK